MNGKSKKLATEGGQEEEEESEEQGERKRDLEDVLGSSANFEWRAPGSCCFHFSP